MGTFHNVYVIMPTIVGSPFYYMRPLINALFTNLGLRQFSTVGKIHISFLYLIFRSLNSETDFLSIDIHFNVNIKGYHVSYFYL